MDYWDKKLIRNQLNEKLKNLKPLAQLNIPSQGWIRSIRKSLGMTLRELGLRVGLGKSRVSRIEQAEPTGEIKLSTLRKIADGLGMKFVYGFIPQKDLEQMVREQAKKIALKRINRLNQTMKLEEQNLDDEELEKSLEDMVNKILVENPQNFWED